MRHPVLSAVVGALVVLTASVALAQAPARPAAPQPGAPQPQARTVPVDEYRIGPEDVLAIAVWNNDAISRVVPVRPDGKISLPLLDDIQAAGLTPMQLRDSIARRLSEYVPSPSVSVIVNYVRSFKVSVIGEVARPARYDLKSRASVLDVLALAGGFNQFANRARLVVLRTDGDKQVRIPFNYNRVVAGEDENVFLRPNDIILVP